MINSEIQEKLENKEIDVGLPKIKDKEEVYQELKKRFRMAWKSIKYNYCRSGIQK